MPSIVAPALLIRPLTPSDLPTAASLAADAFIDDDVFGRFMHPHRREYWADYVAAWRGRILEMQAEGDDVVVAVEVRENGDEEIVGWAAWVVMDMRSQGEKVGNGGEKENVVEVTEISVDTPTKPVHAEATIDRSASIENIAIFNAAKPLADHLWSGSFALCYHLDILCIAPSSQGHGYGAKLVRWGLKKAAASEQDMSTSVIAAWERDAFYERFGFVERGRANVGGLEGKVKGGAAMFRVRDFGV